MEECGLDIMGDDGAATSSSAKKKIQMSDQEILLILRSYIEHPCDWKAIISDIKVNSHTLPREAKELYNTGTSKQLKDRVSKKFNKVLKLAKIENREIRDAVEAVRTLDKVKKVTAEIEARKEVNRGNSAGKEASSDADSGVEASKKVDGEVNREKDQRVVKVAKEVSIGSREKITCELSSGSEKNSDDEHQTGTSGRGKKRKIERRKRGKNKKTKKEAIMDLVRRNQEEYNKFITKKVPKLLRVLGVSDSDSDSD